MGNHNDMDVGREGASLIELVHNVKNIILILYFEKNLFNNTHIYICIGDILLYYLKKSFHYIILSL